jgi:hypothetical protein
MPLQPAQSAFFRDTGRFSRMDLISLVLFHSDKNNHQCAKSVTESNKKTGKTGKLKSTFIGASG